MYLTWFFPTRRRLFLTRRGGGPLPNLTATFKDFSRLGDKFYWPEVAFFKFDGAFSDLAATFLLMSVFILENKVHSSNDTLTLFAQKRSKNHHHFLQVHKSTMSDCWCSFHVFPFLSSGVWVVRQFSLVSRSHQGQVECQLLDGKRHPKQNI